MNTFESMYLSIITNKDLLLRIDKNAGEFMKKPDSHPLYGAPILVVISSKFTPFSEAESDPIKMAAKFNSDNIAHSNAAIIAHNMALEAVELGVGSCYIWGAIFALNDNKALLKELNLPNGCLPCCALALSKTDITYEPRTIPNDRIKYQMIK